MRVLIGALLSAFLVACEAPSVSLNLSGSSAPQAGSIAILSGNNQIGTIGTQLALPLAVKIFDTDGKPMVAAAVDWKMVAGNGFVNNISTTSDSTGVATVKYTLGTTSGLNLISAIPRGASTSAVFSATANLGSSKQLAWFVAPSTTASADSDLAIQPVVSVQDMGLNTVSNSSAVITLQAYSDSSCATAVPGALVVSSNPVTAVNGIATFSGVRLLKTNVTRIGVASAGIGSICSNAINVSAGIPTVATLVSGDNQTGAAGTFIALPFVLSLKDANNNLVPSYPVDWTVLSGGGTLTAATTLSSPANGAALGQASNTYRLGNIPGPNSVRASVRSTSLTVNFSMNGAVGNATKLAIVTQPPNASGGTTWPSSVVIQVQDAVGNLVTSSTASITLAITAPNAPGGTLTGTATRSAVSGVATFPGFSIDKAGTYTLTTTNAASLTNTTSDPFNITVGGPNKLQWVTQPGGGPGGIVWSIQPVVRVLDAGNNLVNTSTPITFAIASNGGPGGVLAGTSTVNCINGVATFGDLSIDKAGSYTIATTNVLSLANLTSNSFTISVGNPAKLSVTTQPSNGSGGVVLATQPVVKILDAGNNVVNTNSSITLTLAGGTAGAALTGTATVAAVSGVVTYSGLSVDKMGTAYTLTTSSVASNLTGVPNVTTNPFDIAAGPGTKLQFSTQPGGGTGGVVWPTQPVISVLDAGGNLATTSSASITLAIGTNAGPGGTLSGTKVLSAVNGIATFSGLSIDKAGNPYTLTATSSGLTSATSSGFNISVGPPTQINFTAQPSGGTGGIAWATQPSVSLQDAGGNTVSSAAPVSLSITTNPSSGTLAGTSSMNAVNGTAAFTGLNIDKIGTGYVLTATCGSFTRASNPFNITTGPAASIAFTTQPGGGTGGIAWTTQPVLVLKDAGGNIANTNAGATVTVAITNNAGPGGVLGGTKTINAGSGTPAYTDLSIDVAGTGYIITATSGALTVASNPFNIAVGPAAQLAFTTQPGGGTGGSVWATQPVVKIQDAGGNVVNSTSNVALTIANDAGPGGAIGGSATVAAAAGVATFSGLSINKIGTGYTLLATSGALTKTSSSFNITLGAATKLAYSVQPGNGTGGSAFSTQPTVLVQDAGGNTVTGSSATIALAISNNAGPGGVLSGTASKAATSGSAAFTGLSINKIGTGYTLIATSAGLASVTSNGFNIAVGSPSQLVFTTQPSGAIGGNIWPGQPVVVVQDSGGNVVPTDTSTITLTIGNNPSSGTLSGTAAVPAANGVATFSGLSIDNIGAQYTLSASNGSFSKTSDPFNITNAGLAIWDTATWDMWNWDN